MLRVTTFFCLSIAIELYVDSSYVSPPFDLSSDPRSQKNCRIVCCEPYARSEKSNVNKERQEYAQNASLDNHEVTFHNSEGHLFYERCGKSNNIGQHVCKRSRYSFLSPSPNNDKYGKIRAYDTGVPCYNNKGEYIRIGWEGHIHALIEICFDSKNYRTHWSHHYVRRDKQAFRFNEEFFDGIKIDSAYKKSKYDRGHLTPKADFDNITEREMTFYHINAAPQFYTFNRIEWRKVENYVRKNAKWDTKIYTGTLGEKKDVALETEDGPHLKVIVPEFFYKVLKFEDSETPGIAFIGGNELLKENFIYKPCDVEIYDPPKKKFIYTFACTLAQFKSFLTKNGMDVLPFL